MSRGESVSRQEPLPEDSRLLRARLHVENGEALADDEVLLLPIGLLRDLVAYADERLAVNRGLMAAAKQSEPEDKPVDLSTVDSGLLFTTLAERGLITVSRS